MTERTGNPDDTDDTDDTDSPPVFPVGHAAGLFVPAERDAPAHHAVRVGYGRERLTEEEFGIWMLAHRPPEARAAASRPGAAYAGRPWSVHELVAAATDAGVSYAERRVRDLLGRGLLAEVTDPLTFTRRFRVASLFLGLGDRPDQPGRYGIGVPGLEPLATVDSVAFELWQWGWVTPSLWAHCQERASSDDSSDDSNDDSNGDSNGDQRKDVPSTAEDQVELVLPALGALLAGFVAFLEPVRTPPPVRHRPAASAMR